VTRPSSQRTTAKKVLRKTHDVAFLKYTGSMETKEKGRKKGKQEGKKVLRCIS